MRRRRVGIVVVGAAAVALTILVLVGLVAVTEGSGGRDTITVYTARLHYGEEAAFERFAERTGYDVRLFGGDGPALNERLEAEGELTEADVLITVDGANLWQAKERGLLQPVRSEVLERNIPAGLRDPDEQWFGLTARARTIMRGAERVGLDEAPRAYADLGDRRWRGRLCLRTSDSVYNTSFVADRLAKHGRAETARMLRAWMANEPSILGSDVEVLEAIAAGRCDVGLTNSYYLGRRLAEDPDFPVAAVFANQRGAGTHVNISGFGLTRHPQQREAAVELMEYLSSAEAQTMFAATNSEFPANPEAEMPARIRHWAGARLDPIDVDRAGALQREAVRLMNEVGWQ